MTSPDAGDGTAARLGITVRPHWVSAWFVRPTAEPVARVDDAVVPLRWGRAHVALLAPGDHRVSVSVRYRGTPWHLGTGTVDVHLDAERTVMVEARMSWLNQVPFQLTVDG